MPYHIQIARQTRTATRDGTLLPGTRLPTEPDLAHQLGIARATLRLAWRQLERDGVLVRRRGQGTLVGGQPLP